MRDLARLLTLRLFPLLRVPGGAWARNEASCLTRNTRPERRVLRRVTKGPLLHRWVGYVSQSTPESAGGVPTAWSRVNLSRRTCPLHWVLLPARPTRKGLSPPVNTRKLLKNKETKRKYSKVRVNPHRLSRRASFRRMRLLEYRVSPWRHSGLPRLVSSQGIPDRLLS